MLINLVKKDLILVKKSLFILLIFAAIAPLYISSQINFNDGGLVSFLLTVILVEYILFGTVSRYEDAHKGATYLCATPYTRNAFVKAKYLFIFVIFICVTIIRILVSIIIPIHIENLSLHSLGITFLIICILFGVLIPAQFKFGYEKTKLISFFITFLIPFVTPTLIKGIQSNPVQFTISFPQMVQDWMPYIISIIIGFTSMIFSLKIYAKKDL